MSIVRFLVVDDAVFMRKLLKSIIESNVDYIVVGEAETGIEAIQMVRDLKPDIITMDITMPEMNGLDAVKNIKKASPNTKIIMVTALARQESVIDALKSGACDFIVKPFEEERVLSAISKVVEM